MVKVREGSRGRRLVWCGHLAWLAVVCSLLALSRPRSGLFTVITFLFLLLWYGGEVLDHDSGQRWHRLGLE